MVMIGIDPHKRSHTAIAVDEREVVIAERLVHAVSARSRSWSRGLTRLVIANGSGRSSRLAGSAICCLSSSSPPVKRSWTFPRRWRLGCGCCRRAVRTRTIPTMLARSRSPRCARRS